MEQKNYKVISISHVNNPRSIYALLSINLCLYYGLLLQDNLDLVYYFIMIGIWNYFYKN